MTELLDALHLPDGRRLVIVRDGDTHAAIPMVGGARAQAGDGAAEALLGLLTRGSATDGRFTIQSWASHAVTGERAIEVDQTNESVIVGDTAVVKWATHLELGPHPAPGRITVLRNAGFTGMPTPWGLITWRTPDGAETLVASVDEYLPEAVDGWTWAVELITAAACSGDSAPLLEAAAALGILIADLHSALASTATTASALDARRWRDSARQTLQTVCALDGSESITTACDRYDDIASLLDELGALAGTPVIECHGDLHVGQILRSRERFVVTDFDGNPVLSAHERMLSTPAVFDVAGMVQSLAHAAVVARKYTELDAAALAAVDTAGRSTFVASYTTRLTTLGHAEMYRPGPLRAVRLQQVLREILYAAKYLPRWMYVPDTALPALLDERPPQ